MILSFFFCLQAFTLIQAYPGHSHDRRALKNGQAQKPNDVLALGIQTTTTPTLAPKNTGVSRLGHE